MIDMCEQYVARQLWLLDVGRFPNFDEFVLVDAVVNELVVDSVEVVVDG